MVNTLLIILFLIITCGCQSVKEERIFPSALIQEGDLAFRCGRGMMSKIVKNAEEDHCYSHIGIAINVDGIWKIVHAIPDEKDFDGDFGRVKADDINEFFKEGKAEIGCLVHPGINDQDAIANIHKNAIRAVKDSLRFDGKYDLYDGSSVYCTEFIWRLFKEEGIDLTEGRRRWVRLLNVSGEVILPEHILNYSGNEIYYRF